MKFKLPTNLTLPVLSLTFTLVLLSGCSYIPFGGGELSGTEVATPTEWSVLEDVKVIKIETQPEAPYSVNLWVVGIGPVLYIHSGDNRTTWVEHLETNPKLRLKNGDSIYQLSATRVTDADEYAKFSEVYAAKYGNPPRNSNVGEVYIYRLK